MSPGQAVNLPAEESSTILADDTALMQFGFRFLRQVLFGENSIALKQEAAERRRGLAREKARQIELGAREKRAAEQGEMNGDPES